MALKAEAEELSAKAARIVAIIVKAQTLIQQGSFFDENPDLPVNFDQSLWNQKVAQLKADCKAITALW